MTAFQKDKSNPATQSSIKIDVIVVKKHIFLNFVKKYVRLNWKKKFNVEYAWMCLNKQDSEYVLGPTYAKNLNMAKFWMWQVSQYTSVTQHSEHGRICLGRVLYLEF